MSLVTPKSILAKQHFFWVNWKKSLNVNPTKDFFWEKFLQGCHIFKKKIEIAIFRYCTYD
jgi:hypothetical protein